VGDEKENRQAEGIVLFSFKIIIIIIIDPYIDTNCIYLVEEIQQDICDNQAWIFRLLPQRGMSCASSSFFHIKNMSVLTSRNQDLLPRSVFSLQDAVVRPFGKDEKGIKEKDRKSILISLLNYTRQLRANATEISDWIKALSTNALLRKCKNFNPFSRSSQLIMSFHSSPSSISLVCSSSEQRRSQIFDGRQTVF